MIDFTSISDELLHARGCYATVRGEHEDRKKELQILCGQLSSHASQILRRVQPDNDEIPQGVDELIASARLTLDNIQECVIEIESLASQRQELKQAAWGKP